VFAEADRIATRISRVELERRWSAVRAAMVERSIDALVMQSTNDWLGGAVRWFTDRPANNGYPITVVFPLAAPMVVVEMGPFDGRTQLDGFDAGRPGVGEVRTAPSFTSIEYTSSYDSKIVVETLRRHRFKTIGLIGGGYLPPALVREVEGAVASPRHVVDATALVDEIKAIKSADEVALIQQTAALQDTVFAEIARTIRPGMRDSDVATAAWRHCQLLGSEQGIILGASAPVGERSPFLGRHHQGRTLALGDHLSILIEVNGPGGFYTELARTIVLGRASGELLDGFAAVQEAQNATLRHMRPGVACGAIAAAHDSFMQSLGLPVERRLYAHGQGYDMVERPLIREDETMRLRAGLCLAVHPGYETSSQFSVICDNYMIGPNGPGECLHRTEKKIFEV
jgi:Xaa-Pro aminopeptidase